MRKQLKEVKFPMDKSKMLRFIVLGIVCLLILAIPIYGQGPPEVTPPPAGIKGEDFKGMLPAAFEVPEEVVVVAAMPIEEGAIPVSSQVIPPSQGVQNEAVVATKPTGPSNIVVTFNNAQGALPYYPRRYIPTVTVTYDGGQTWQQVTIPGFPAQTYDDSQGNPSVGFLPSGRVLYAVLSFRRNLGPYGGVYVSRSDNGGTSWSAPIQLDQETGYLLDIPNVATSPIANKAAVCWTRMENWNGSTWSSWDVWCRISTDGGVTWAPKTKLTGTKKWTTVAKPYFGTDGTWYTTMVSFDTSTNVSDVLFFKEGGNRRTIASQSGVNHYSLGAKPAMVEDSSGILHLVWGDGVHIYHVTSADKGSNWSSPQVLMSGGGGIRFMKPSILVDPLGRVVVGGYRYSGGYLQVYAGLLVGGSLFPVGPRVQVICDIAAFECSRQYMGDWQLWASNYLATKPGGVLGLTSNLLQQSNPPGYVSGLDNNIEVAVDVPTVAWPGSTTTISCRPSSTTTGPLTTQIGFPIFNRGFESATFQITGWSGETGCPALTGIPTTPQAVGGRLRSEVPITVNFPAVEDRLCSYTYTTTGGYGSPSATSTLHLKLEECGVYLPVILKNYP